VTPSAIKMWSFKKSGHTKEVGLSQERAVRTGFTVLVVNRMYFLLWKQRVSCRNNQC